MNALIWADPIMMPTFSDYWRAVERTDPDRANPTSGQIGKFFFATGRSSGGVPVSGFSPSNEAIAAIRSVLRASPHDIRQVIKWSRQWDLGEAESHDMIEDRRSAEFLQAH